MDRMDKINEQMKREIGHMLQTDFQDSRLLEITITQVAVSRDLEHAKVMYSFWGQEKKLPEIKEILEQIRGYVRKLVGQRIRIRHVPEIKFVYDRSTEYSARIEKALQDIQDQAKESKQKRDDT